MNNAGPPVAGGAPRGSGRFFIGSNHSKITRSAPIKRSRKPDRNGFVARDDLLFCERSSPELVGGVRPYSESMRLRPVEGAVNRAQIPCPDITYFVEATPDRLGA